MSPDNASVKNILTLRGRLVLDVTVHSITYIVSHIIHLTYATSCDFLVVSLLFIYIYISMV
jgi:hypothetical protein